MNQQINGDVLLHGFNKYQQVMNLKERFCIHFYGAAEDGYVFHASQRI